MNKNQIILTDHFIERLKQRWDTNNINPQDFIINTFIKAQKDISKKKRFYKITEKDNCFIIYIDKFKICYNLMEWKCVLITFAIRDSNFWKNH